MKFETGLMIGILCVPVGVIMLCGASENTTNALYVPPVTTVVMDSGPSYLLSSGYVACIAPEQIPTAADTTYDADNCMETGDLLAYPVEAIPQGNGTTEIFLQLEDDQTAVLFVDSRAVTAM